MRGFRGDDITVSGIEVFDLTGTGDIRLLLRAFDVLERQVEGEAVTVLRDAGDTVEFTDAGWVAGAIEAGFQIFTNGTATVRVQEVDLAPIA